MSSVLKPAVSASASATTGKDASRKLARHAATLRYEAIPGELIELTKQCVLDTLGVTIGASGLADEAKILADYVGELGGRDLIVTQHGERRSPVIAATPTLFDQVRRIRELV